MAKCGIKTFPLAVDNSDELKLIEAEFGVQGFAVIIKLHQCIFSKGYYTKWGWDEQLLFIDDYRLSSVGRNAVNEIVACSLRRGVFDSRLYEQYNILTNRAIQETFLIANKRSKEVKFEKNYALPVVYEFIENVSKNDKSVNIFFKNADILEQRKGKERKGKESRVDSELCNESEFTSLFDDIIIDTKFCHTFLEYKCAKDAFGRSQWLRSNIKHLSKMHRVFEKIATGYYDDFKTAETPNLISRSLTADELDAMYGRLEEDEL